MTHVRSIWKRRLGAAVGAALLVAVGFGLGLAWPVLRRPPLVLGQDAVVSGVAAADVRVEFRDDAGGFLDVRPAAGEADVLLVFYPGGLVRPQAYEWLGRALAPHGVRTVIPVFPFDLAVTDAGRASRVLDAVAGTHRAIVIAGHSLGGAMATRYALRNPERVDALVLMAAYGADSDDLTRLMLPTLVLAAEEDGLASLERVRGGLERLPAGARLVVLEGVPHAFFGRYGPQAGDGVPRVARHEAEERIVRELARFLASLP